MKRINSFRIYFTLSTLFTLSGLIAISTPVTANLAIIKIIYVDGSIYEGEVNGKSTRHGKGKYIWSSGDIYEGNWVKGQIQGFGKMIYTNGDIYEGNWTDGKPEGEGKYTCADGDVYQGLFKPNGWTMNVEKATLTYTNGNIYEGDIVECNPRNKGKLTYANGDVYEGNFVDGMGYYTGKNTGKYTWKNGDIYVGEFEKDGSKTGTGKFIWKNNDIYEGDFVNGQPTGKGKLTYANGKIEDGDWKNGKFVGGTTAQAAAPAPKIATVASPQSAEDEFQTDLKTATTSYQRSEAINKYYLAIVNGNYTNEEKGTLIADKVIQTMVVDADAAYGYFAYANKQFKFNFDYVYKLIPADKKEILKQKAQRSKDKLLRDKMGL